MNERDNDGFMVLLPKGPGSIKSTPSHYPTPGNTIGNHRLTHKSKSDLDEVGTALNSNRLRIRGNTSHMVYMTDYKPKAWQYKAWSIVGCGINWSKTPPLKNYKKLSKKMRHMIRLGVAMKVRANIPTRGKPNSAKPVIMQIAPKNNDYGIYLVGDTTQEIIDILEKVYDMIYNHVDEIVATIDAWGYEEAIFITKIFVIYDDKSYDCLSGDPRNLFRLLDITFNKKGKVNV